jgi:hypothetical protein
MNSSYRFGNRAAAPSIGRLCEAIAVEKFGLDKEAAESACLRQGFRVSRKAARRGLPSGT